MSDARLVDIAVFLKHETNAAWLVNDGAKDVWVPKSQCELHEHHSAGGAHELTLPEWLAKEKGLI